MRYGGDVCLYWTADAQALDDRADSYRPAISLDFLIKVMP